MSDYIKRIEITCWRTDRVLFEHAAVNNTMRIAVQAAVKAGVNLSGAYLYGANLGGVDLGYANLSGAYLTGADLSGADLGVDDFSLVDAQRAGPAS